MPCAMQTFRKDPDANLDYGFDWSADPDNGGPWLDTGETIATSAWTVPAGITGANPQADSTTTKIWLSGGTAGNTYTITNRITTSDNRTDERSFQVTVEER